MKFYRHFSAVKAISFDLDDTLYANRPVMIAAEEKMLSYFAEHFSPQCRGINQTLILNSAFWQPFRAQAIEQCAALSHDVVALRLESYFLGACYLGYPIAQARKKAQQAMFYFSQVRSQFVFPEASHQLLSQLSQKFPLVAISNGNVDTKAIGIAHYFQHVFHAVDGIKQKPDEQMFVLACQKLNISPQHECSYFQK